MAHQMHSKYDTGTIHVLLPGCSLLLQPVNQIEVAEGLLTCFRASALCITRPADTGTTATFLVLGCHFHSVLE